MVAKPQPDWIPLISRTFYPPFRAVPILTPFRPFPLRAKTSPGKAGD